MYFCLNDQKHLSGSLEGDIDDKDIVVDIINDNDPSQDLPYKSILTAKPYAMEGRGLRNSEIVRRFLASYDSDNHLPYLQRSVFYFSADCSAKQQIKERSMVDKLEKSNELGKYQLTFLPCGFNTIGDLKEGGYAQLFKTRLMYLKKKDLSLEMITGMLSLADEVELLNESRCNALWNLTGKDLRDGSKLVILCENHQVYTNKNLKDAVEHYKIILHFRFHLQINLDRACAEKEPDGKRTRMGVIDRKNNRALHEKIAELRKKNGVLEVENFDLKTRRKEHGSRIEELEKSREDTHAENTEIKSRVNKLVPRLAKVDLVVKMVESAADVSSERDSVLNNANTKRKKRRILLSHHEKSDTNNPDCLQNLARLFQEACDANDNAIQANQ
ncbi:hypothetical protein GLOIN_2v1874021 [Rhizophagus clarus]|uniref:Uncharacterized protein n=1 Tax=Rhizophagus clarus TaxID=94130 RepID=A0A8H3M382_9GLOM|nr:hypothetical protein GLOIN_2v1874021 [Rhizophagus clarus]